MAPAEAKSVWEQAEEKLLELTRCDGCRFERKEA